MTAQNPAIFLQAGSHPAEDVRRWMYGLSRGREGILRWSGTTTTALRVTEKSGTPDMSVDVAGGAAYILGDEATYQGTYFVENRGTTNLAISSADPTNPRKDLVVAKVQDSDYSGATDAWSLAVVTGTPAASPTEPTAPDNSITLALVDVPASDTAITNSQITDRRQWWTPSPLVRVQRVASQSTGTGWSSLSFDTEHWDTDGMWSSGATITIPTGWGGRWQFEMVLGWAASSSGSRNLGYRKNGGSDYGLQSIFAPGGSEVASAHGVITEVFDEGDTFEVRAYQSAGTLSVSGWCAGMWVGP